MKQGGVGPIGLSEGQQQSLGTSYVYGTLQHSDSSSVHGTYTSYLQGSSAMGIPAIQSHNINSQKDVIFPERPGQPECQYYMKTGDCKFGITCRYHHPKDRATPSPTCILSPIGLPLRPVRTLPMFIVHVRWNLVLCDWLSLLCFPKYLFLKSCNELFLCMTFFLLSTLSLTVLLCWISWMTGCTTMYLLCPLWHLQIWTHMQI
jgi:hypothetical protein